MFQLRNRPRNAQFAFFGLGLCGFALTPTETGYQDIASLLARQPGVAERWHARVFAGAKTLHVAAYSFSLPIGTAATCRVLAPANTRACQRSATPGCRA